jgi:hypothetical protein
MPCRAVQPPNSTPYGRFVPEKPLPVSNRPDQVTYFRAQSPAKAPQGCQLSIRRFSADAPQFSTGWEITAPEPLLDPLARPSIPEPRWRSATAPCSRALGGPFAGLRPDLQVCCPTCPRESRSGWLRGACHSMRRTSSVLFEAFALATTPRRRGLSFGT